MVNIIIGTEALSFLILLIIIISDISQNKLKSRQTQAFFNLCFLVFIGLLFDFLSYIVETNEHTLLFIKFSCFISILAYNLAHTLSLRYIGFYFYNKLNRQNKFITCLIGFSLLNAILLVVFGCCGLLFNIDPVSGEYSTLTGYYIVSVVELCICIAEIVFAVIKIKNITFKDFMVIILFISLPITQTIFEYFIPEAEFSYSGMVVTLLIVYLFLQYEAHIQLIKKGELAWEKAHLDFLTQLKNRYAYNDALMDNSCASNIGVIYCDVNGLKYTNDNFGHEAGDKLLCDFANIVRKHFGDQSCYRIAGDEFVILLFSVDKSTLEQKYRSFLRNVKKYQYQIASVGRSFGDGEDINNVINKAEDDMYKDKKKFHNSHPELCRPMSYKE
ncbi:MAG: diguanylate cyclase [Bacilli bacterium]|nr:diguanylate cyclase [Bacilli bacterium]